MDIVIRSRKLSKEYSGGTLALNGVDLQVKGGEIFGFLGPNGAGKTTFVKTILSFVRPTSGEVHVLGMEPSRKLRERIGYLPERVSIHPFLSGREFLRYQAKLSGMPSAEREKRINECLGRVKMEEAADRRIDGYSKGMLQRVGLARALLPRPEVLLLDEPNSGLDPIGVQDIRSAILEERDRGAAVFLNSHQLQEVEKTCDRVAILNRGRVVAEGTRKELTGEQGIELEIEGETERIKSYLSELDPKLKRNGTRIILSPNDPEKERLLPAKIVEMGARIVYYAQKQESMEEIFRRIVEESETQAS